jgi:type II secretory pathway component PulM
MNGQGVRTRRRQVLAWAVALLVLLGTLQLYRDPDFMVRMADLLWSCF